MHEMFAYLAANGGAIAASNYSYTGTVTTKPLCAFVERLLQVGACRGAQYAKAVRVRSHTMVPRGDETALLNAVSIIGPVAVAYNAGTQAHAYYRGGVLRVADCGNSPTHAVLLVGYGTDAERGDFWILKNSWGTGWGEQGYFRMVRGQNMCGVADWASFPTAY